jgi:2,4-dienoyl-CoA reductase-like NADH-dependent reductase (Old Yellow Enzyme family)
MAGHYREILETSGKIIYNPVMEQNINMNILNTPLQLRNTTIKNRFIRSATYDGYGDKNGMPFPETGEFYAQLARGGVGGIITGFAYITRQGRAMQPRQYGIDSDDKIPAWQKIVEEIHNAAPGTRIFLQIAHCGRQTRQEKTILPPVGVSSKKCTYYKQRVKTLDDLSIRTIIRQFGEAAYRAKQAGFDGIQLHGAHGYLIHQFLSPWTNTRKDRWAHRALFLEETVQEVKKQCGPDYPVLVKLSGKEDNTPGVGPDDVMQTVKRLEALEIDAVEISCGTMEYALNIMRGKCPLDLVLEVNPLFNRYPKFFKQLWKKFFSPRLVGRFLPFEENYNAHEAEVIKKETNVPVITVGGIRKVESMVELIDKRGLDAVALCRPLICEPDLPEKILNGTTKRAKCINCNLCTIYCDTTQKIKCHVNFAT